MEKELDFDKYLMILQIKIDYSSGDMECMHAVRQEIFYVDSELR